jgi:hypothetical protein
MIQDGKPPRFAILNHAALDSGIPRESTTQRLGITRARTGANVFGVAVFNIRVDRLETRFELSRDRFAPARYGAVTALVLRREDGDARALLPAQSTGWP